MKRATVNLGTKVNVALIDGKDIPIQMKMFSKAFVSGDSTFLQLQQHRL